MHPFVFRSEAIFFVQQDQQFWTWGGNTQSTEKHFCLKTSSSVGVSPRLSPPVEQEAMHFRTVYFPKEINKGVKRSPGSVVANCFCMLRLPAATLTESSRCVARHDKRWGPVSRFVQQSKLCLILSAANIYT